VIKNEATESSLSFGQVVLAKIASQIGKVINNIKHSSNSAPTDTSPHPTLLAIQCVFGITTVLNPTKVTICRVVECFNREKFNNKHNQIAHL
jgi:hypothetical protein